MFKRILVPLDGSSVAECVLPHVVALAHIYDAAVEIIQVLNDDAGRAQPTDPMEWELRKAEAEAYLEETASSLQATGVDVVSRLLEGQPAVRIVEYAHEAESELIVMSSHGRAGLSRWNVNSVVRKVVQRAHISTLIIRAYHPTDAGLGQLRYGRILVPLDGSQRAECVLSTATTFCQHHDSHLLIGHVVVRPEMPRQIPLTSEDQALVERFVERNKVLAGEYLDSLRERLPLAFEHQLLVDDDPALALHKLAVDRNVNLVIMSAHGYSGKKKWPYGSITTSFIEYGSTPLLVIQDLPPQEVEETEAEAAAKESKGH